MTGLIKRKQADDKFLVTFSNLRKELIKMSLKIIEQIHVD